MHQIFLYFFMIPTFFVFACMNNQLHLPQGYMNTALSTPQCSINSFDVTSHFFQHWEEAERTVPAHLFLMQFAKQTATYS